MVDVQQPQKADGVIALVPIGSVLILSWCLHFKASICLTHSNATDARDASSDSLIASAS